MAHHQNTVAEYEPSEQDRVNEWTYKQFVGLGIMDNEQLEKLMIHKADYHVLERLIKDGCPIDIAIDIVT